MSVSVDVVPHAESLDLYGESTAHSAFSLSGHVNISIASPYSVFERRRAARILLQSVQLTFDGQSEVITNALGYSSIRLCSISRELVTGPPLELTNLGQEHDDAPAQWHVVFDLAIPGWLPASHDFAPGDLGSSTQYFLNAVVKFVVLDESSSWSFYSPFRSKARTIEVSKSVNVRRFVEPPTHEPVTPPSPINYLLSPPAQLNSKLSIPPHVLSKIQVLASVPAYTDVCSGRLPFTLRLRTKDLEEEECQRLEVKKFSVDIVQEERCRRVKKIAEFETKFPIPAMDMQPPNKPLLNPSNVGEMYQLGLYLAAPTDATRMIANNSMLPLHETGVYHLTGETHIFAEDTRKDATTWYTLETLLPFTNDLSSAEEGKDWEGALNVRPTAKSPLYDVAHSLKLAISVEYQMPGQVATADLTFSIPLTMARIAPPLPPRDLIPALFNMVHLHEGSFPPGAGILPNGAGLPVYSQLFDAQGNRKLDDMPLPRYAPAGCSPPEEQEPPASSTPPLCLPNEKRHDSELDATSL